MKRILFFIVSVFSALSVFSADQFYVIMKDGSVESYPTDKVDSITFDDPKIEKILGFNEMAAEIVNLKKEIEDLKANCEAGGTTSNGMSLSLLFGYIDAKDLPLLGISTDTVVDMGLSVKWTNFNVGASNCYDYGDYYAWGETESKKNYSTNTYDYNKPFEDVATQKWGDNYRMPKLSECRELVNNCIWLWIKVRISVDTFVSGYVVKSKITDNAIFLPAAGYRSGTSSDDVGSDGYYWSSTVYESDSFYAYNLYFDSGSEGTNSDYRYSGRSVRPVLK